MGFRQRSLRVADVREGYWVCSHTRVSDRIGAWAGTAIYRSERPLWVGLTRSTHDRRTTGFGATPSPRPFADLVGTELPDGSYRDRHRPPQAANWEDHHTAANDRYRPYRPALSVELWSPERLVSTLLGHSASHSERLLLPHRSHSSPPVAAVPSQMESCHSYPAASCPRCAKSRRPPNPLQSGAKMMAAAAVTVVPPHRRLS